MAIVDPDKLVRSLIALPRETEWLEFKSNRFQSEEIGQYVSSIANAAMLHNQECGYLIFGVSDEREIVGTKVSLKDARVGADIFEHWLSRMLQPSISFEFVSAIIDGLPVEIISISPAYIMPVRFKNEAYIRVDSVLKPLRAYPERERALWSITSRFTFERGVAAAHLSATQLFELFDPERLLSGLGALRLSRGAVIQHLISESLVIDDNQGGLDATNLLAVLAAKDITQFPSLARKMPRVITYTGPSKLHGKDDISGRLGYGLAFPGLLRYIMDRISHKEEMRHGMRQKVYAIPEIAVREFVVNALIHQDLTSQGDGPIIEIYSDRMIITNPGKPLMDPSRLIDTPARSRNETLAAFMRRLGFCEERGSGVDRAVDAIEHAALPPPLFRAVGDSTVVTMFGPRGFAAMTKEDRIRACYQHASLRFEAGTSMSNQSLRTRFGLSDKQYPQASIVIRDALDANQIRPLDEDQGNRNARYLPYWAT